MLYTDTNQAVRFIVVKFTATGPKTAYTGTDSLEAMNVYSFLTNATFVRQSTEPNGTIVNDTLGRK